MHVALRVVSAYVAGAHSVQAEFPPRPAYCPTWQSSHADAPLFCENVPATHMLHLLIADEGAKDPA